MRFRSLVSLTTIAGVLFVTLAADQAKPPAKPAEAPSQAALFDGKSLNGWRGYKKPDATGSRWTVQDGMLTLPPTDGKDTRGARDIISVDTFDLFDLSWEWKIAEGGNSGVKYFIVEDRDAAIGHEYQIIDDARHADAKVSTERQTASFYDVKSATTRPTRPVGDWNTSRVLVSGNHVEHWLNGAKVLDYELGSPEILAAVQDSKFSKTPGFGTRKLGHILLQDHGDAVCYRSIKIKPGTT
jgi:hypothetical protein